MLSNNDKNILIARQWQIHCRLIEKCWYKQKITWIFCNDEIVLLMTTVKQSCARFFFNKNRTYLQTYFRKIILNKRTTQPKHEFHFTAKVFHVVKLHRGQSMWHWFYESNRKTTLWIKKMCHNNTMLIWHNASWWKVAKANTFYTYDQQKIHLRKWSKLNFSKWNYFPLKIGETTTWMRKPVIERHMKLRH